MARTRRIYIDNACYHLIARGNRKEPVFRARKDYVVYAAMLKKAKGKHGIKIYAYCLMPNHIHLLVEPRDAKSISTFMHWMNKGYAAYYNLTYNAVGHLWQDRFRSKPIIKDDYLLNCAAYIEENPIRAQLADEITGYEWSSYQERCLSSQKKLIDAATL